MLYFGVFENFNFCFKSGFKIDLNKFIFDRKLFNFLKEIVYF